MCYYEYMTDSDSDGKPDKGGDGFASRLLVKDGKLTCEYVDADGQTLYGSYDLVPLLDDFLEQHPDFSYRGARATIAVTGYQGAFGYRISSDYQAKLGAEAFAQACKDAREVADALRAEGYTIASHSYGHLTYGDISPERLAGDAQKWNDQIAAVIGETDVLLYPFGSDIAGIEAYKGAKFDTLYGLGFRYFCNVDSAEHWVQIHDGYVRQGRRNIDGYDVLPAEPARRPVRHQDRLGRRPPDARAEDLTETKIPPYDCIIRRYFYAGCRTATRRRRRTRRRWPR